MNDNTFVYVSFSQGYRPGGINVTPNPADPLYQSELVDAFELGVKTLWLDGSLAITGAAFFNDFDDLQAFSSNGDNFSVGNLDAETRDVELEATWRPLALAGFTIDLTYAWLDTEILPPAASISSTVS